MRASEGETAIRQRIYTSGSAFIVVPDATQYRPDSWLRQPRDWLARINFDADSYVLAVRA